MNVFNSLSYRDIIQTKLKAVKSLQPGMGLLRICSKAGLHGSFVSSALKGHKHLNQDQVYALGSTLGFSFKELDYILLLLSYERSVNHDLKAKLKEDILTIQKENKKTSTHIHAKPQESMDLELAEYYADPYYKIIHIFLGVERFSKSPVLLSEQLNLSAKRVQVYLQRLEEMGIIKFEGASVSVLKGDQHLPKDFFICKPHQAAMKLLSQQSLFSVEEGKKETVCVTFSGEDETYKAVHQEFLTFLTKVEKHVKKSHCKEVFQLNFDLHYWSK